VVRLHWEIVQWSPIHKTPRLQGVSVGEGSLSNFDHSNGLRSALSLLEHAGRDSFTTPRLLTFDRSGRFGPSGASLAIPMSTVVARHRCGVVLHRCANRLTEFSGP